jgi:hypothetical protein
MSVTLEVSDTDYLTCVEALANKLMLWDFERADGDSYNDVAVTLMFHALSIDLVVLVGVNGTIVNNGYRIERTTLNLANDVQAVINATHTVVESL